MIKKLNKHEFFKAKNVIKDELKKGNVPIVTYSRNGENNPYTIYIVRDGGFHDYVAHAKRESLVKQKIEDINKIIEYITSEKLLQAQ